MTEGRSCFISAGEYSGDLLAADLANALQTFAAAPCLFGITGPAMLEAGVKSIGSISELSMMGFAEVAVKLADLRILEKRILESIDRQRPSCAILVDFPGFHFRLAEQLRLRDIPVIQYIAPKLWAWGEERVSRLRRDFELVLGIFPFEQAYFQKRGVPYAYVGTPHLERCDKIKVDREALGFAAKQKLIAFLPGSRMSEIKQLLPVFVTLWERLLREIPEAQFVVPIAPNLELTEVKACLPASLQDHPRLSFYPGMSLELMAAADVCCLASGTATLECALLGTPMVVVYRMSELSYLIAEKKVTVSWISLVNLLLGRGAVAEFVQNFSYEAVVAEIKALILDTRRREQVESDFTALKASLSGNAAAQAAREIMGLLTARRSEKVSS